MKKMLMLLVLLAFCLPVYGEVLVFRYSDKLDLFNITEVITPTDINEPDTYSWDVLIKDRVKGYLVLDIDYSDFSIKDAALIAYWSNKGSATTGNPKGKFNEMIELDNLKLVRTTEALRRNRILHRWILVDAQNSEDFPEILMVAGKGRITGIGLGRYDKREVARSMRGYTLGDSTQAGIEVGELQMGKVAVRFSRGWTKIANKDPEIGGFGGDFDAFISAVETNRRSIRGYLTRKGYGHANNTTMLDAPEWESIDDSNSPELLLDWTDVDGALKYSVDIDGIVSYFDPNSDTRQSVAVELSFGTGDRTDGGLKEDSDLTISESQWDSAVLFALFDNGVDPLILRDLAGWQFVGKAKVKALNPGKGNGRQNHPFSVWSEEFTILWNRAE